jgi:RNA polymerase sigma factor FliA
LGGRLGPMADKQSAGTLSPAARAASGTAGAMRAGGAAGYRDDIDEADLIKRYVPTVKRLAAHLKGRLPAVQLDDLVQAGLIALLRLARRGDSFPIADALLRRSLINAMIDEARRTSWTPTRIWRLARTAAAAMQAVGRRLGRVGSDEEIAAELAITVDQYHQLLVDSAGISIFDLDAFGDGAEAALQIAGDQEERLRRSRIAAALATAIAALPERERTVISLYYEHELNMEEVGEVLGLDKSTVSRSHGRALLMLRSALSDWGAAAESAPSGAGD